MYKVGFSNSQMPIPEKIFLAHSEIIKKKKKKFSFYKAKCSLLRMLSSEIILGY